MAIPEEGGKLSFVEKLAKGRGPYRVWEELYFCSKSLGGKKDARWNRQGCILQFGRRMIALTFLGDGRGAVTSVV